MECHVSKQLASAGNESLRHLMKGNHSRCVSNATTQKIESPHFQQHGDYIRGEVDPEHQSKYEAYSYRTGKALSPLQGQTKNSVAWPIDAGDKCRILHLKDKGKNRVVLSEVDVQTYKTIGYKGGELKLRFGVLGVPQGAVDRGTDAQMGVSPCGKEFPPIPDGYWNVIPIENILSSQGRFHQGVVCKLHLPFLTADNEVEFEVMRGENGQWIFVGTVNFTKDKTIEFTCDHFSPIAVLFRLTKWMPFSFSKQLSKRLPMQCRLTNIIYCDEAGNFIVVTCLDDPTTIHECAADLRQYTKLAFLVVPFNIAPGQAAHYALKILRPQPTVVREWDFEFDANFTSTFINQQQFSLSNDGQFDLIRFLEVSFERQCEGGNYHKSVNVKNPLYNTDRRPAPSNVTLMRECTIENLNQYQ